MSRYWFDTEFLEDGKTIELISIGIVCEDGRTYYAEAEEFDWSTATPWLKKNVLPHLSGRPYTTPKDRIALEIRAFCDPARFGKPEFWGYYADYDWVVFCQLFGRMIDLPKGFPMYCHDLKQWADQMGDIQLPKQTGTEHNALADARWNKVAWEFLAGKASGREDDACSCGACNE